MSGMACLACASWLGEPPRAELQRIPTACVTRYRQPPLEDRMLGLGALELNRRPGLGRDDGDSLDETAQKQLLSRGATRATADEAALLFEAYGERVRRYIAFRVRSPEDAESLPGRARRDEELRRIDVALATLVGRQRAAIYLRFYEDLEYADIASVMGIPAVTARTLVHRGLKKLAGQLGEAER